MRYFFLLLLALPFCANAQFSNGFAPVGAVWKHRWTAMNGTGYMTQSVTNSQTIGNTTYKTVDVTMVRTAVWAETTHSTKQLIIRNDSVWVNQDTVTNFIYDFRANVGDSLYLFNGNNFNFRAHIARVDSVKVINFQGQFSRAVYYNEYCRGNFVKTHTLIQDFGLLDDLGEGSQYVTWETATFCAFTDGIYFNFACYNDPTRSYPQNCIVSTEEKAQNKAQIAVFPNPTNDILKINSSETIKNLKITNVLGKIVIEKTENNTETTISVESLPKGVYFLRVNDVFTQKVVKN